MNQSEAGRITQGSDQAQISRRDVLRGMGLGAVSLALAGCAGGASKSSSPTITPAPSFDNKPVLVPDTSPSLAPATVAPIVPKDAVKEDGLYHGEIGALEGKRLLVDDRFMLLHDALYTDRTTGTNGVDIPATAAAYLRWMHLPGNDDGKKVIPDLDLDPKLHITYAKGIPTQAFFKPEKSTDGSGFMIIGTQKGDIIDKGANITGVHVALNLEPVYKDITSESLLLMQGYLQMSLALGMSYEYAAFLNSQGYDMTDLQGNLLPEDETKIMAGASAFFKDYVGAGNTRHTVETMASLITSEVETTLFEQGRINEVSEQSRYLSDLMTQDYPDAGLAIQKIVGGWVFKGEFVPAGIWDTILNAEELRNLVNGMSKTINAIEASAQSS